MITNRIGSRWSYSLWLVTAIFWLNSHAAVNPDPKETAIAVPAHTERVPDGLALIYNEEAGSYGHGFVIDNHVVTAAHIVETSEPLRIFVTKAGKLTDVTSLVKGEKRIHSQYSGATKEKLKISAKTEDDIEAMIQLARVPYDVALVELSEVLASDFILPTSKSKAPHEWFVARIVPDIQLQLQMWSSSSELLPRTDLVRLSEIGEANVGFDVKAQSITLERNHKSSNVLVDASLNMALGEHGAPLVAKHHTGRLMVMGMVSGFVSLAGFPKVAANPLGHNMILTAATVTGFIREARTPQRRPARPKVVRTAASADQKRLHSSLK